MIAWFITGCVAFVIIASAARGRPGVGIADASLLVFLLGLITVAELVLRRFFDTGDTAWAVAAVLAFVFAIEALYGLMAPERQRRRDRKLRALMQRRRA